MKIGQQVMFVDERGREHQALITKVFDNGDPEKYPIPALNVVYVSQDDSQSDQYGRQIVRKPSVPHTTNQSAHGYMWYEQTLRPVG